MEFCSLIDVRYTLKVQTGLKPSEWLQKILQKDIKLRTNILIGSVPLTGYQTPLDSRRDSKGIQQGSNMTFSSNKIFASCSERLKNVIKEILEISEQLYTSLHPVWHRKFNKYFISPLALPLYKKSQVYPSSKPSRDDPTGDDGDSDGEMKAFEPMYRIYKFER